MELDQIVGVVACLLAAWGLLTFNLFARARAKVRTAWGGVDAQLKLRHDLVPRLTSTVRAYAGREHDEVRAVAAARSQAIGATRPFEVVTAENVLASELGSMLALAEGYPELTADASFNDLVDRMAQVEIEIQAASELYNEIADAYNARAKTFPNWLVTGWMRPRAFALAHFDRVDFAAPMALVGELTA